MEKATHVYMGYSRTFGNKSVFKERIFRNLTILNRNRNLIYGKIVTIKIVFNFKIIQ